MRLGRIQTLIWGSSSSESRTAERYEENQGQKTALNPNCRPEMSVISPAYLSRRSSLDRRRISLILTWRKRRISLNQIGTWRSLLRQSFEKMAFCDYSAAFISGESLSSLDGEISVES